MTIKEAREDIQISRLERKIEKLKRQVNYYKEQCCHYQAVINLNSGLKSSYQYYMKSLEEQERIRQLEARVVEQAKLIRIMEK